MSIKKGSPYYIPNWIKENDWTPESRLNWIRIIMTTSSRDWCYHTGADIKYPDAETWAIYLLSCCDTKDEAKELWEDFCET